MAHHKSAIKRIRSSEKQKMRNRHYKSKMRTEIKKVLNTREKEAAETQFRKAMSVLDRLASKGIIHANNAANHKAKLAKYVNSLAD